jgi:DUF438 domain-containing protein
MSEFINNTKTSDRVQRLLEFTKRVHDGEPVGELEEEYREAIHSVEPHDVLVIEHTVLESGTPIPTIKEEIEPLLETFRTGLASYDWDRPDEGHPIDVLMRENRVIEEYLASIREAREELTETNGPPLEAIQTLQESIGALDAGVDRHFVRKENELFPHLETHLKYDRPLGVMWSLHDDIRSAISVLSTKLDDPGADLDTLQTLLDHLETLLQGMIFKEENIIYPVAATLLEASEWREIQENSLDIGYFEVDPKPSLVESPDDDSTLTDDSESTIQPAAGELSPGEVAVGLETGTLSLDQIELLFDTLPVDVTFVDEEDTVRYFNNPEDRVFPRSGSIIGRSVQNCHPPESIDKVEKILTAFRRGEEDSARFWIRNDDAFVVIDYYAMRDGTGQYRGTLEVTREVSDIRSLSGEQRLVEWGE